MKHEPVMRMHSGCLSPGLVATVTGTQTLIGHINDIESHLRW